MNSVLDYSLVGLALLMSAGYAITSLGPRNLRPRVLGALGRAAGRAPAFLGLRGIAQRLADASAAKTAGGCGGCDNCGSEKSATPSLAQESPGRKSSVTEVRVPVAKIGRRV